MWTWRHWVSFETIWRTKFNWILFLFSLSRKAAVDSRIFSAWLNANYSRFLKSDSASEKSSASAFLRFNGNRDSSVSMCWDNRQHDWLIRVMLECYLQAAGIIVWSRSKSCLLRLSSPERARLQELQESILASESNQTCTVAPPPLGSSSPSKENLVLYVPEVEEIRISPVIARKGYLNVLEHKTNGWKKRWVVRLPPLNYSNLKRRESYIYNIIGLLLVVSRIQTLQLF